MKIGIDSYCFHRFFGEVYPDQKPADKMLTLQISASILIPVIS